MRRESGLADLVDVAAVVVGPRAPLVAVDVSQVAVLVGPFVPYPHSVLLQVAHVGVAAQKPQQFVYDAFQMQFLGGEQWEALAQVEAHLVAEDALRARARSVGFLGALFQYEAEQVLVLFHGRKKDYVEWESEALPLCVQSIYSLPSRTACITLAGGRWCCSSRFMKSM